MTTIARGWGAISYPNRTALLNGYVGLVVLAAVACVAVAAQTRPEPSLLAGRAATFAVLVVVLVLGELRPIKFMRRYHGGESTATWMISIALVMMFPVVLAVLTAGAGSMIAEAVRRKPPIKVLFNGAQIIVALSLGAGVLGLAGHRRTLLEDTPVDLGWLVTAITAVAVVFVVNSILPCIAIALSLQVPVLSLLRQSLTLNLAYDGMLLALAPILVVAAERSLVLVPLLLVTALAVHGTASLALERQHGATHDRLTGIANRWLFVEHATAAILEADRRGQRIGIVVCDLDGFKQVNDTLGHHVGDEVLRTVADRLQDAVRGSDLVARLGGDEFAILFTRVEGEEAAASVVTRLHTVVAEPMTVEGLPVTVGASFGVSLFPDHGPDLEALLRRADAAMYQAKNVGGGVMLHAATSARRHGRLSLLRDVPRALERDELVLHYQPVLDLRSGRVASVEALVRWQHPEFGLIPPSEFVALIEQSDYVHAMTRRVLREAVRQCAEWRRAGIDVAVAVNGSAASLQDPRLTSDVIATLEAEGVEPDRLALELTEHAFLETGSIGHMVLTDLRDLGVRIAVDDFGTGYSSLTHLRQVPADTIKIDRSFVTSMSDSPRDTALVSTVIDLAATLGMRTVAEGIEDEAVLRGLRELGCDYAQGYHIARPAPADELEAFLRTWSVDAGDGDR